MHFVSDHLKVLHSECEAMVREERKQDLKNIYPLLRSVVNGLPFLVEQFLQHVKNEGLNAVSNLQGDNVSQAEARMLSITNKIYLCHDLNFSVLGTYSVCGKYVARP